jgi:hypothetical protein
LLAPDSPGRPTWSGGTTLSARPSTPGLGFDYVRHNSTTDQVSFAAIVRQAVMAHPSVSTAYQWRSLAVMNDVSAHGLVKQTYRVQGIVVIETLGVVS